MAGSRAPIAHPREWQVARLGKLATKIGSGATPTGGADSYLARREQYALIRSQNVFDRRFNSNGLAYISDEQARRLNGVVVQPGDLLLNITGDGVTFARACAVPPGVLPACVNQHVSIIRVDKSAVEAGYILAYLTHPAVKAYIESFNAGGSRRAITKGHIESFEVPLPPLADQRAIAHILGTLDEKIELNRRMIQTLEAMAMALFKSWFVDFDPVRAKIDGRDPGLYKPLGELFPGRLVDSELGEIPEGWEVKSLDEIARFVNGLALQKYPPVGDQWLPVIKIAQLRSGRADGGDRATAALERDYIVVDGDILFSWSGSLECVVWAGGKGALNQHLFKVTSTEYPRWLCYFGVHQHLEDFRQIAAGKATTMGHIQRHHLSNAKLAVPAKPVLHKLDQRFAPLFETLWKREAQSRTLAALRDLLLPKLLSGELRVNEAERHMQ